MNFGSDRQTTIVTALRDCEQIKLPDVDGTRAGVADALAQDGAVNQAENECLEAAARHIEGIQAGYGK